MAGSRHNKPVPYLHNALVLEEVFMVTIRDYATSHHVSYEAIRSQVARFKDELEGHIIMQNRTQLLDDWAVNFLNQKRREHPFTVMNDDRRAEIEALEAQVESLKALVAQVQEERNKAQLKIQQLQEDAMTFLEEKVKHQLVLQEYEANKAQLIDALTRTAAAEARLEEVQKRADTAETTAREERERSNKLQQERDDALVESLRYQKSWFGFYRKV